MEPVHIGVIGGSGLYDMPELTGVEELTIETPFGAPSDVVRIGTLAVDALTFGAGLLFPPAAAFTAPIGVGLAMLAVKSPGTFTKQDLISHGEAVADKVVPAVVAAATASAASGQSAAVIASTVRGAAAAALPDALYPKK